MLFYLNCGRKTFDMMDSVNCEFVWFEVGGQWTDDSAQWNCFAGFG